MQHFPAFMSSSVIYWCSALKLLFKTSFDGWLTAQRTRNILAFVPSLLEWSTLCIYFQAGIFKLEKMAAYCLPNSLLPTTMQDHSTYLRETLQLHNIFISTVNISRQLWLIYAHFTGQLKFYFYTLYILQNLTVC